MAAIGSNVIAPAPPPGTPATGSLGQLSGAPPPGWGFQNAPGAGFGPAFSGIAPAQTLVPLAQRANPLALSQAQSGTPMPVMGGNSTGTPKGINLTRAWTASSLTPGLQGAAQQGVTSDAGTNMNPSVLSLLSNIFGKGGGLNSADMSGQVGTVGSGSDSNPAMFNDRIAGINSPGQVDPAAMMAQAYAQNLQAKNVAMLSLSQAQNASKSAWGAVPGAWGESAKIQASNAAINANDMLKYAAQVSQAAALSPTYAPNIQKSVSPPGAGGYNQSGWISPVQSGYSGAFGSPSRMDSQSLMSRGV